MKTLTPMIERNLAALCEKERYFAPAFMAARNLLDAAHASNGGLMFPSGAVCGPQGCSCGDRACLHAVAWRVFRGQ